MRVLLTTDTVGGVWTYALELIEALARHDVEFILATLGAPLTSAQRLELARLENLVCHESAYRLEWMEDPWSDQEAASEWLMGLAARESPDLIQLNSFGQAALPWSVPTLLVAHSCVLTWWRAVRGGAAPPSWDRYREVVRSGLSAADLVVTPTAALLAGLEAEYGPVPGARVIYNGVATDRFYQVEKEPSVLGAGRIWDEAKNLGALAEVAERVNWPVYLAGATEVPGGESRSSDGDSGAPSTGPARYLGRLSARELRGRFARAAVYALPARYEPFGLSALEAALSGCALVLGDIPTLREVWGEAAIYLDPDDRDGLERVIRELLGPGRGWRWWGREAREVALSYTAERMAREYHGLYQELLAGVAIGVSGKRGVEVS